MRWLIHDPLSKLRNQELETIDHLFVQSVFSKITWHEILSWRRLAGSSAKRRRALLPVVVCLACRFSGKFGEGPQLSYSPNRMEYLEASKHRSVQRPSAIYRRARPPNQGGGSALGKS